MYLDCPADKLLSENLRQQRVSTLTGERLAVSGVSLAPYSSRAFSLTSGTVQGESPSVLSGNRLETPFAIVEFDEHGYLRSLRDKAAGLREPVDEAGYV